MLLKALVSVALGILVAFVIQLTTFLKFSQTLLQADIDNTHWSDSNYSKSV